MYPSFVMQDHALRADTESRANADPRIRRSAAVAVAVVAHIRKVRTRHDVTQPPVRAIADPRVFQPEESQLAMICRVIRRDSCAVHDILEFFCPVYHLFCRYLDFAAIPRSGALISVRDGILQVFSMLEYMCGSECCIYGRQDRFLSIV